MHATHIGILDLIKAVACNLIVLHHLAFYGPMADQAWPLAPGVFRWLDDQARIAVHAFVAIGGFLAAKSLSQADAFASGLPRVVLRRFARLAPPFMVAMVLAVVASALASVWMAHDSISAPPTAGQLLAHALLLHDVLGYEALSAGAWYVAIDFQLFALFALVLWMSDRGPKWLAIVAVIVATSASLLVFNLNTAWNDWAPYFFGSYGLGALAWWAADPRRRAPEAALLTAAILLLGWLALALSFRSRVAVALSTALLLVLVCRGISPFPGQTSRLVGFLGRISYAIFLAHFPVCLVVNAVFTRFASHSPAVQATGVLLAWMTSIGAGAVFHRLVELPLAGLADSMLRRPLRQELPKMAKDGKRPSLESGHTVLARRQLRR
jgi:peptidoglycan/LPS O-acetylase OafA/YrhL